MGKPSFESQIGIINEVIEKRRGKWRLFAISWMDFEDVAQELRIHIYKKWDKWDHNRPLGAWVNKIISNQMINKIRNHYSNFARPCVKGIGGGPCVYKDGETGCLYTVSKQQTTECPLYAQWVKKKKSAFDINLPLSMEHHQDEINDRPDAHANLEQQIENLKIRIKNYLTDAEYKIFVMLYVKHMDENKVAESMGFKTTEKRRKAGYRQIMNYKKSIIKKAKKMLNEEDINHV